MPPIRRDLWLSWERSTSPAVFKLGGSPSSPKVQEVWERTRRDKNPVAGWTGHRRVAVSRLSTHAPPGSPIQTCQGLPAPPFRGRVSVTARVAKSRWGASFNKEATCRNSRSDAGYCSITSSMAASVSSSWIRRISSDAFSTPGRKIGSGVFGAYRERVEKINRFSWTTPTPIRNRSR